MADEPRIAEGVAISASVSNNPQGRMIAMALEMEMQKAVLDCIAKAGESGGPYPSNEELKAAMMAARERVLAEARDLGIM